MTAKRIISLFDDTINAQDPSLMQKVQVQATRAQLSIHDMHSRALACHCECMGMEVENGFALAEGKKLLHSYKRFKVVMTKWGLIDEDNQPKI